MTYLISRGGAQLRQHLADRLDRARDAALAELSHAADAEGLERGQLAGIEDIAERLDGVVEALELVARVVRGMEGHDDRGLDRRRQEALQAERGHAIDQRAAVARVARAAGGEPAFLQILGDGAVEGRHHMGRRRVAPLRGLLHVDPLIVEVHGERVTVALALLERCAPRDHEAHAGRPLEALAGGGHDRIEWSAASIDLERAEGAHGIDDQPPLVPGDDLCDLIERIEDACAGLAMDQRDVGDGGVGPESPVDVGGGDRGVLGVVDGGELAPQHPADARDALAVSSVLWHEHVARARHQGADRSLDREGAAALERNALVRAAGVDDVEQPLAHPSGDAVEVDVPRSPVAQHRLLGAQRDRERTGSQEIGFVTHRTLLSSFRAARASSAAASAAITLASSTRMTSMAVALPAAAMLPAELVRFAAGSSTIPAHSNFSRMRRLISGACSPIPPPKAMTSTAPSSLT